MLHIRMPLQPCVYAYLILLLCYHPSSRSCRNNRNGWQLLVPLHAILSLVLLSSGFVPSLYISAVHSTWQMELHFLPVFVVYVAHVPHTWKLRGRRRNLGHSLPVRLLHCEDLPENLSPVTLNKNGATKYTCRKSLVFSNELDSTS